MESILLAIRRLRPGPSQSSFFLVPHDSAGEATPSVAGGQCEGARAENVLQVGVVTLVAGGRSSWNVGVVVAPRVNDYGAAVLIEHVSVLEAVGHEARPCGFVVVDQQHREVARVLAMRGVLRIEVPSCGEERDDITQCGVNRIRVTLPVV
jgi:hypothetical protein